MILGEDKLREVARARSGDLTEVPFGTLLFALFAHKRTCVLELTRNALKKGIVIEEGTPVDCTSNLLHETLGKFLVATGKLTNEQYTDALTESANTGDPMGTVLLRAKVITAIDLFRGLQQNLAHKLLDVFSWETGEYRVLGDAPEIESALRVNVPQLVLTGIERFVPKERVEAGIAPLIGHPLAVDPKAAVDLESLRLNARRARMAHRLAHRLRIDELMQEANTSDDEVMRFLYALGIMRVVRPASEVPVEVTPPPEPAATAPEPEPEPEPEPVAPTVPDHRAAPEEVVSLYVDHRRRDAFDLLDVAEDAEAPARAAAWLAFAERFAPWAFVDEEGKKVREQATELFLAGARAYGELSDGEQRNSLINRRRNLASGPKTAKQYSFEIRTDLLDATSQLDKGRALMEAGKFREAEDMFAYAVDLSPGDATYRAELAYCRFLQHPETRAATTLLELEEVTRIDPRCGVAWLHRGAVHQASGDMAAARDAYERASQLMGNDGRPRDALSRLGR